MLLPMPLHLVSWNLNGLDPHHLDERMEAACLRLLLNGPPPDVVAGPVARWFGEQPQGIAHRGDMRGGPPFAAYTERQQETHLPVDLLHGSARVLCGRRADLRSARREQRRDQRPTAPVP